METRQILIKIITRLEKAGTEAAKRAINDLTKGQKGVAIGTGVLGRVFDKASKSASNFGQAARGVGRGFANLRSAIQRTQSQFALFDSLFFRVTFGMLTWQAWRTVVDGFRAISDAIVTGNVRMQQAQATFTALAGGSEEMGQTFVDVTRQIAVQTGTAFDKLIEVAQRFPTQVGQNFQAFEQLVKTSITLGFLDPIQGAKGAAQALSNALEGTAQGFRSLVQRFEFTGGMENVKRILEETKDPLEAIDRLLREAGIDVEAFTQRQMQTLGVAWQGLINIAREFLRVLGEPVIEEFTKSIVNLFQWLLKNQAAVEGLARAIGDILLDAFLMIKATISDAFGPVTFESAVAAVNDFLNFFISAIEQILNLISFAANAFASLFGLGQSAVTATASTVTGAISGAMGGVAVPGGGAGTQAGKAVQATVSKTAKAVGKSARQITSALSGISEGGKQTIENLVKGLTEGASVADLEKVGKEIMNNVISLEAQELAQEKSIEALERWVDEAEREVNAARDKLKIFDIETAEIPERFTRARRRQLELEVLRAEQERRRRREALDIAKQQLKATKEALRAQRQILSLIEAQTKEAQAAGGISREFTPPSLDPDFKKRVEEFRRSFRDRLQPIAETLRGGIDRITQAIGNMTDSLSRAGTAFGNILGFVDGIFGSVSGGWAGLDPGLRKVLLVLLGITVVKTLPVIAATIQLAVQGVGLLAGLGASTMAGIVALFTGAAVPAAALILPISLLVAELAFAEQLFGVPASELLNWFSGRRPLELVVIIKALFDPATTKKVKQQIAAELGLDTGAIGTALAATPLGAISNIAQVVPGVISGIKPEVETATEQGVVDPITGLFLKLHDLVVGKSIIPDMLNEIVRLFTELPLRLMQPLEDLRTLLVNEITMISMTWLTELEKMNMAMLRTLELQGILSSTTGQTGPFPLPQMKVGLKLNANETKRLMQEGVFEGLLDVGGSI